LSVLQFFGRRFFELEQALVKINSLVLWNIRMNIPHLHGTERVLSHEKMVARDGIEPSTRGFSVRV